MGYRVVEISERPSAASSARWWLHVEKVETHARMIERGYSLERTGSIEALRKLGLDLAAAAGRRFTFCMDDADEHGRPDDIMFNGVVIHDTKYGYLAQADDDGVYWRSQISELHVSADFFALGSSRGSGGYAGRR
jgi:hypothetical protein